MLLDILKSYVLAFVPIFIAVDIIGIIPLFLSLTEKFSHKQKKKVITESVIVASILIIVFTLCGKQLLKIIGITISDFKIAGGLLLIVLSINLLLFKQIRFSLDNKKYLSDFSIFPLAVPLITGPALLTISLITLEQFGVVTTLIALILNMAIAWLVLENSEIINKFIGWRGISSLSKIFEILLAALGVMMIRQGIMEIFF